MQRPQKTPCEEGEIETNGSQEYSGAKVLSIEDLLDEMGIAGRTAAFLAFSFVRFMSTIEADVPDATGSSKYLENDRLSSVGPNVAWPRSLDVF